MSSKLKNLYTQLIINQKHHILPWHDAYTKVHDEVKKIRQDLEAGKKLSPTNDKCFLEKLIFKKNNGVASRGQSILSKDNFKKLIEDEMFLRSLEALIKKPDITTHQAFEKKWKNVIKSNNPVLVNRVAAACTLDVSTTVDVGKFNKIFDWLIQEKIMLTYPENEQQDWFSKNIRLMRFIKDEFNDEIIKNETNEFYLSQFIWLLFASISKPFTLKKQIIKYGPPGTGKTYKAKEQTEILFDLWEEKYAPDDSNYTYEGQLELVQFHPSYSYEDFMEGLRPVPCDDGSVQLILKNGIFKEFCRKAGKWETEIKKLSDDLDWETLTIEDIQSYKDALSGDHWSYLFNLDKTIKVSDAIPPFFFIIDEVNRAELSRVFGELMYCLEYRGAKDGCIKTQYADLNNESTGMLGSKQGYKFFIPNNLYIIGTMNTIDRSIESFDFALRRRFQWEEVLPDTKLLEYHLKNEWKGLAKNLEKLNTEIAKHQLLGSDYQIGHAYLMNLKYDQNLTVDELRKRIWDNSINPLLQEYFRGTGNEQNQISSLKTAFGIKEI